MSNTIHTIPAQPLSGLQKDAAKPGMADVPAKPVVQKSKAEFLRDAATFKDLFKTRAAQLDAIPAQQAEVDDALETLRTLGALTPVVESALAGKRAAVAESELETWRQIRAAVSLVIDNMVGASKAVK